MEKVIKIFTQMIKAEVLGEALSEGVIEHITPDIMEELYLVSKKHDLSHIVAVVLQKHNLLGENELSKKFSDTLYTALMRYENMQYELEQICEVFESEKIAYIPLKGSVIRKFYADPWLRTSCDIDILVHQEDSERACELLHAHLNYLEKFREGKVISLFSPSGVHLELHYMIQENRQKMDKIFCEVWDYVQPAQEEGYRYEMTPEFFMFYILAHTTKHFLNGGCGVRALVDIWLLTKYLTYDELIVQRFCEQSDIWKFVQTIKKLTMVYFENESYDELTQELELHIIAGGTYGTKETTMVRDRIRFQGRKEYILERIFMPYNQLCILFPRLIKIPVLYPYYTVLRWFKVLRKDVFKRVAKEAKTNGSITEKKVDELKSILEKLNLSNVELLDGSPCVQREVDDEPVK